MYKIPRCKTKSQIPQPSLNVNIKIPLNKFKYLNSNRYYENSSINISNINKNMTNRQVRKSLSTINEKVNNKIIII